MRMKNKADIFKIMQKNDKALWSLAPVNPWTSLYPTRGLQVWVTEE